MLRWFIQDAPIKTKFTIGFGAASVLFGVAAVLCGMEVFSGGQDVADVVRLTFFYCLAIAILTPIAGLWMTHVVAQPLSQAAGRLESMTAGDLDSAIPHADHRDDVGRLARAMQAFKSAIEDRQRMEAEAARSQAATDNERQSRDAERRAQQAAQQQVLDGLAKALNRLSAGELTYRITEAFPAEYESLRAEFNTVLGGLQQTIGQIASGAEALQDGSSEISRAADDLSRRTEQQAASLEETAAALDEITATVRRTAEGAEQARTVVGSAKASAEHSGEVVRRAIDAMSEIETSSGQIGRIIGVIDEIAFQTNLLALNAGVEAARAGGPAAASPWWPRKSAPWPSARPTRPRRSRA
jgi:methyl-accepting chemotaxis protein